LITTLDTQSWSQELVTGNAEFVAVPNPLTPLNASPNGLYVVSNVRTNDFGFGLSFGTSFSLVNSFTILRSVAVPPAAGPGASFQTLATYVFNQPNTDFDPVAAYDYANGLLHIIGTRNTPTPVGMPPTGASPQLNDLIKFTFNTNTNVLTGPVVLSTGARIRGSYDISVLTTAASVTATSIAGGVLTVTATNTLAIGQNVILQNTGELFLNNQVVTVATLVGSAPVYTGFTAAFAAPNYTNLADTGTATAYGNYVVGACLADPILAIATVTSVTVANNLATFTITLPPGTPAYVPGQWILLDGFTNAAFLNGQLLQVTAATTLQFTAGFGTGGFGFNFGVNFGMGFSYGPTAEPAGATASPIGESLLAMERDYLTDALVPGSAVILESSPSRLGNSFDAVSIVVPPSPPFQGNVELYYQTHPKNITFQDQIFQVKMFNRTTNVPVTATSIAANVLTVTAANNFSAGTSVTFSGTAEAFLNGQTAAIIAASSTSFTVPFVHANYTNPADTGSAGLVSPPVWDAAPTVLTTFSARWADDRLTVLLDPAGNRYMSQTYWNQLNHPEGIVGNAFLGYKAPGQPWFFHPTFGSVMGGSIVQGTLSIDATLGVSYIYLLQPFDQIPAPPSAIAWPLHAATVSIPDLGLTEVPGFYNGLNMTWLRGTKSLVDEASEWAVVGEQENTVLPLLPTTVPIYVSLFNVPPIASVFPTSVTLWRENSFYATDVALVTQFSVTGNVVTAQVANDFAPGEQVAIYGFQNPPNQFLNGITLTVTTATPTQFQAAFTHPNYIYQSGFGFGINFGFGFGGADFGFAAVLIPGPLVLDASASHSPSLDPLGFVWTDNYPNANVTLTPTPSGTMATLTVDDNVGGPGFQFEAGVAVIDLASPHPPANADAIQIVGNIVTFTIDNLPGGLPLLPLAPGEQVMPYDIAIADGFGFDFGLNFGPLAGNTVLLEFLNDQVLTVLAFPPPTPTSFSAICNPPNGFPVTLIPVTGFVMPQFQFAQTVVTVPTNTPPTVTFPLAQWGGPGFGMMFGFGFGLPPFLDIARNTTILITPDPITGPNQYPVVYTGLTDPDDEPTFLWQQTSGTTVATPGGVNGPSLQIDTAGVSILGETLTFSVTVSDEVNPPVTESFSIVVAAFAYPAGRDTLQLSRSVFGGGLGIGGFGFNFGFNFGNSSATIAERNVPQTWSPLDVSIMYTNLQTVKRNSVLDGTDRYIVISPYSVLVYAVFPNTAPQSALLRVLLLPNGALIQDAVHTEQDYTLVLDSLGNVWRYSTAALIYTDAPDAEIVLSNFSSLSFVSSEKDNDVHILTTQSFLDSRVLVFSGEQGALLLQVATDTLAVQATLELTTADHFLYGADKVQFVRWVGMESVRSGDVLLGTIANNTAEITGIDYGIAGGPNALTVTCANSFRPGDVIVLSGITFAPVPWPAVFNGMQVTVVSATATAFVAYINTEHVPQPPTPTYPAAPETGLAVSQDSGTTYESLVSLSNHQVLGTFDKSRLKNQFVNTGEFLFNPDTTYAGRPIPPVLAKPTSVPSGANANISLVWAQERADLVSGYIVQVAVATVINTVVPASPFQFAVPNTFTFDQDVGVTDLVNTATITGSGEVIGFGGFGQAFGMSFGLANVVTLQANNNFQPGQFALLNGLTAASWLNGLTLEIIYADPGKFQVIDPTAHAPLVPGPDTGTATVQINSPLTLVTFPPAAGMYNVTTGGLYTFSVQQAGHSVNIMFIQQFTTVATIIAGSIQSATVQLPAGQTYYFHVEALSLDGPSGFSNVQKITV
jgi:hypothetical protein